MSTDTVQCTSVVVGASYQQCCTLTYCASIILGLCKNDLQPLSVCKSSVHPTLTTACGVLVLLCQLAHWYSTWNLYTFRSYIWCMISPSCWLLDHCSGEVPDLQYCLKQQTLYALHDYWTNGDVTSRGMICCWDAATGQLTESVSEFLEQYELACFCIPNQDDAASHFVAGSTTSGKVIIHHSCRCCEL